MNNGYKWEVLPNVKQGGLFLNQWDSIHGNDTTIVIAKDGTCHLHEWVKNEQGELEEKMTFITDLGKFLADWVVTKRLDDSESESNAG